MQPCGFPGGKRGWQHLHLPAIANTLWLASHVVGIPWYDSYSLARLYSRCQGHAAPCTATTKRLPCFECEPVLPCNLCTARYHVTKSQRMQQALPCLTNPARHIASLHVHVANAMPVAEGIVQQPACHTKAGGCTSRAVLSDQVQTRPPLPRHYRRVVHPLERGLR